jgi:ribosomal protein L32
MAGVLRGQYPQKLTKDAEQAAEFYRYAANEGHVAAQHRLGECFDKGEGVEEDKAQAAFWYRRAANQGDMEAQFRVGVMYAEGLVVKNNRKAKQRAKHFMQLAAGQGCEKSFAMLKELRKCDSCGTLDVHHMMCPLCKMVRYCNRECQIAHWKRPTDSHRSLCAKTHRAPIAGTGPPATPGGGALKASAAGGGALKAPAAGGGARVFKLRLKP